MSVGMYETANALKGLLETFFELLLAMALEAVADGSEVQVLDGAEVRRAWQFGEQVVGWLLALMVDRMTGMIN